MLKIYKAEDGSLAYQTFDGKFFIYKKKAEEYVNNQRLLQDLTYDLQDIVEKADLHKSLRYEDLKIIAQYLIEDWHISKKKPEPRLVTVDIVMKALKEWNHVSITLADNAILQDMCKHIVKYVNSKLLGDLNE